MRGRYTRILCSAMLSFEALVMLLSILALMGFFLVAESWAVGIGGGIALVCVVAVGSLGRHWGYALGHVIQIAIVVVGIVWWPMAPIMIMFAGLWTAAYVVGMRIDQARAIR